MSSTKRLLVLAYVVALCMGWRSFRFLVASDSLPATTDQWNNPQAWEHHSKLASISEDGRGNKSNSRNWVLIHVAVFGLGHRLIRTAAAWHVAQRWQMNKFKFQWGTCGNENHRIFPYLFGSDEWDLPQPSQPTFSQEKTLLNSTFPRNLSASSKRVMVRNDVYGYYSTQTFLSHRLPLPASIYPEGLFGSKLESDVYFYQQLRDRYVFKEHLDNFRKEHQFSQHTVLGLHLRTGNGEQDHFAVSGRGIANETEFVTNLLGLLQEFVQVASSSKLWNQPPLLFLATDTPYLIPVISNATLGFGVRTVVFPQIRMEDRQGVTFSALEGQGTKCLMGWQAMVSDMMLLSDVDVLVAGRFSSFTQSLPLAMLFHQKNDQAKRHFCEVSTNGTKMECSQDLETWLFQKDPSKRSTYSLPSQKERGTGNDGDAVKHKKLIFLPDPNPPEEYDHVLEFLKQPQSSEEFTPTHTYGSKRVNPKYRSRTPVKDPGWNFTSAATI